MAFSSERLTYSFFLVSRKMTNLQRWPGDAESHDPVAKGRQRWIDGGEDSPTVSPRDQQVCDGSDDADLGLGPHFLKSHVDRTVAEVVDDLGGLHGLAGGHVESGHIPANVAISDDSKKPANRH